MSSSSESSTPCSFVCRSGSLIRVCESHATFCCLDSRIVFLRTRLPWARTVFSTLGCANRFLRFKRSQVCHCAVGPLACTRRGDVGVNLDNFTFPLTLCHTSFECRTVWLLFVLLLGGESMVNFISHLEECGLQCIICLALHAANLR